MIREVLGKRVRGNLRLLLLATRPLAAVLAIVWFCTPAGSAAADAYSKVASDEALVLFPTLGSQSADGSEWQLDVHGCVFEMDTRKKSIAVLSRAIALSDQPLTSEEARIFAERARPFLLDYERGKRIYVEAGGRTFFAGASGPDGHFQGQITLTDEELRRMQAGAQAEDQLEFRVRLRPSDPRHFGGSISLFGSNGVLVVSDIDDTIKITGVLDRQELLRRTFLRPFEPVPDMAGLYRHWNHEVGTQFCYVSGSPWQLSPPLVEFLAGYGFPSGPMFLRRVNWSGRSLLELQAPPRDHKLSAIHSLAKRFPRRSFILVGDSGEQDPEIYGELARAIPQQVQTILIRDVTGETSSSPRYATAFAGLRPEQWKIFNHAEEIRAEVARP